MTAIELIIQERNDQLTKHNYTVVNDIKFNPDSQLVSVACGVLLRKENLIPNNWDKKLVEKMMLKSYKKRLIISGALIVAELERILTLEQENIEKSQDERKNKDN